MEFMLTLLTLVSLLTSIGFRYLVPLVRSRNSSVSHLLDPEILTQTLVGSRKSDAALV